MTTVPQIPPPAMPVAPIPAPRRAYVSLGPGPVDWAADGDAPTVRHDTVEDMARFVLHQTDNLPDSRQREAVLRLTDLATALLTELLDARTALAEWIGYGRDMQATVGEWRTRAHLLNIISYRVAAALAPPGSQNADYYLGDPVARVEQLIAERDGHAAARAKAEAAYDEVRQIDNDAHAKLDVPVDGAGPQTASLIAADLDVDGCDDPQVLRAEVRRLDLRLRWMHDHFDHGAATARSAMLRLVDQRDEAVHHAGRARRAAEDARSALIEVETENGALVGQRDTARRDQVDLAEAAWTIIANAGGGDWDTQTEQWRDAATRWRDRYHALLAAARSNPGEEDGDATQDTPVSG